MMYMAQFLLVISLIIININYNLSLNCYSCLLCPDPFDPSSRLVHNDSNCQWCAKLEVPHYFNPIRQCTPKCDFEYFSETYPKLTYHCCQNNYCNKKGLHNTRNNQYHWVLVSGKNSIAKTLSSRK
ncbi:unnamed protein product [Schistosoma haematobium]|nr:unnamed protein product [Schistosoma haematobium]CAH8488537.1 unnamed protein product [Schistosoma haematobium]